MKNEYILVIDSGVGGLSILTQMLKLFSSNVIYFADNKHCPYGSHSRAEILKFLVEIIDETRKKYRLKIVVLACNTATTSAISSLRKKYKDLVFVGTEPALNLANNLKYKHVLSLTTPVTAAQSKYTVLRNRLSINIKTCAMPCFASNIEQNLTNPNILNALRLKIDMFFIKNHIKNHDCVVLGCTHYGLIKDKISNFIKLPCIDGSLGVARQTYKYWLLFQKSQPQKSKIIFCQSSLNSASKQIYKKILGQILANSWKLW